MSNFQYPCYQLFFLDLLSSNYQHIIFTGDFKMNTLELSTRSDEFGELFKRFGMRIVNSYPTHFMFDSHTPTYLEIVIFTDINSVSFYVQLGISRLPKRDMIVMSYNLKLPVVVELEKYFRNYAKNNNRLLLTDLHFIPWNNLSSLSEPDDIVSFFNSNLVDLIEHNVPSQRCKNANITLRSKSLDLACLYRDMMHRCWRRTKDSIMWLRFVNFRTTAKQIEIAEYQKFYSNKLSTTLSSSELRKNVSSSIVLPFEIPNNFRLSSSLVLPDGYFSFSNITLIDTLDALNSIKSKTVGTDNSSPKFINIILPHILPYIHQIYISFLTTSKVEMFILCLVSIVSIVSINYQ